MRIIYIINGIVFTMYSILVITALVLLAFVQSSEFAFLAIVAHISIGITQPILALIALYFINIMSSQHRKRYNTYCILTILNLVILAIIAELKPSDAEFLLILFVWVIPFFLASYFTYLLYSINKYDRVKKKPLI